MDNPEATGDDGAPTRHVTSAIDRVNGVAQYVIADVSRDGVWLSVPVETACRLSAWR